MIYQFLHAAQSRMEFMNKTFQAEPVQYDDGAGRGRGSLVDTLNSPAVSKGRWVMLAFAFVATVINYLDRQTLSVLAPVLLERFRISATTYSHIIFAFMLAYTVMNGVSGPLLDRLIAACLVWWLPRTIAPTLRAAASGAM